MACPKSSWPLPPVLLLLFRCDWEWAHGQKSGPSTLRLPPVWRRESSSHQRRPQEPSVCLGQVYEKAGQNVQLQQRGRSVTRHGKRYAWQIAFSRAVWGLKWQQSRSAREVWFLVEAKAPRGPVAAVRNFTLDYKSKKFNHMFKAEPGAFTVFSSLLCFCPV